MSKEVRQQVAVAVQAVENKKGEEIVILEMDRASGAFTDYFVLCTATNPRQVQAISDEVEKLLSENGERPASREGYQQAEWVLLDYVHFVVHIFSERARKFYDLERLWKSADKLKPADLLKKPAASKKPAAVAKKSLASKTPVKRTGKATPKKTYGRAQRKKEIAGKEESTKEAVKIQIAWIGKTKEASIRALTEEYLTRISRYVPAESLEMAAESALLEKAEDITGRTRPVLVLLDSRGRQFTSEEFADLLRDQQDRGTQNLFFAVGPADGFSDRARGSADLVLSFGKMTLAHELARIVLLEQIYRAFTILKGHPYHTGH